MVAKASKERIDLGGGGQVVSHRKAGKAARHRDRAVMAGILGQRITLEQCQYQRAARLEERNVLVAFGAFLPAEDFLVETA